MITKVHLQHAHESVVHGVRLLKGAEWDFRPTPNARSARELVLHMYEIQVELAATLNPGCSESLPVSTDQTDIESYIVACHELVSKALDGPNSGGPCTIPPVFGRHSAPPEEVVELILLPPDSWQASSGRGRGPARRILNVSGGLLWQLP